MIGDGLLAGIGNRYDETAVQVAVRWLIQQDGIVAIPKATGRAFLEENLDVFDFYVTDDEMERITGRRAGIKRRVENLAPP